MSGTFIQSDPIGFAGGSLSLYNYVNSSPLTFNDPLGLSPTREFTNIGPTNSADSLMATTAVSSGVMTAGGAIVNALYTTGWPVQNPEIGQFTHSGFCSPSRHAALQQIVEDMNNAARKCVPIPNPQGDIGVTTALRMDNLARMQYFSRLVLARATINAACFGGGDAGHRSRIIQDLGAMNNCRLIIRYGTANPKYPRD